ISRNVMRTSPSEMDQRTATLKTAQAAVGTAKARRDSAEIARQNAVVLLEAISSRVARLKVLEAQVDVFRSVLEAAEADLDATYIRAPEDGCVVRRIVESGGSVRLGYPIIAVRLSGRVWIEAWVDEAKLADVRVGSPAEISLGAIPEGLLKGRVESIGALTN